MGYPKYVKVRKRVGKLPLHVKITNIILSGRQPIVTFLLKSGQRQVQPLNEVFFKNAKGTHRPSKDIVDDLHAIKHDLGAVKLFI